MPPFLQKQTKTENRINSLVMSSDKDPARCHVNVQQVCDRVLAMSGISEREGFYDAHQQMIREQNSRNSSKCDIGNIRKHSYLTA